jgi:glycerol kinase
MDDRLILAIDQGTTNTKALLVASDGSVRLSRSRAMRVDYPQPAGPSNRRRTSGKALPL